MSRIKRIFLSLVIAVPIVLVISYFTNNEDEDLINADQDTINTFIQNNVGADVQLDRFQRLKNSSIFLATYHVQQNGQVKIGHATFEERKEGKVKYQGNEFGAISHTFAAFNTDTGNIGVLYGVGEADWKQAQVIYPEAEYTFKSSEASPYMIVQKLDASIEDIEDFTIQY